MNKRELLPPGLLNNPEVQGLPVLEILEQVDAALGNHKKALVQAPPGAGKTTIIPLALLHSSPWLGKKKILVLEPRRLAARACAGRMAALLGEKPGQTIGYQVRMDRCISPRTRVEIITEGILTRRIQNDPELAGVGAVIFDEFHERHLHSDLGLALTLESAQVFSPELRLLVMSATMDMEGLAGIMADAPVILSRGRSWPVTTHYLPPETALAKGSGGWRNPGDKGFEILPACEAVVKKAVEEEEGDILVFLPGAAQIRAMAERLAPLKHQIPGLSVHPLFGNLSPREQSAAIAPSPKRGRKIVLSTPIAETSLTIEGVRVVVDSGLARVPMFSPETGMTRLVTLAVSKASADQRRGRAGRTGPGVCYRLWSPHVHQGLIPFNRPEILGADLSPLVLELALWGVNDPLDLDWLDEPPAAGIRAARELLVQLGALETGGDTHGGGPGLRITDHGKKLAAAGTHPRLAQMIIRGKDLGLGFTACCLAALVEARDILRSGAQGGNDPDIRLRLEILERMSRARQQTPKRPGKGGNSPGAQVLDQAGQLARQFSISPGPIDPMAAGRLLGFAWPGRIARQRKKGSLSYVTASGRGCFFRSENLVSAHEFMVAVHLDGSRKNAAVFLAAPYDPGDLEGDFKSAIETRDTMAWDSRTKSVRSMRQRRYRKMVLEEKNLPLDDPEEIRTALIRGIATEGLAILPWTKKLRSFQQRVVFLKTHGSADPGFDALPDLSDPALIRSLETWLAPFLDNIASAAALKQVDLGAALQSLMSWDQLRLVEEHAPTHIRVPSGSNLPLAYEDDKGPLEFPVLGVRLQEMFGLTRTPSVGKGRIPVTLHLLSPAGRPVQITRDLKNFWASTYAEVKKDLMGRYPKHYWPDDPLSAQPTRRAKPNKKYSKG